MAKRWTEQEKKKYRAELAQLYNVQNKTINEIGLLLNLSSKTVFDRLKRLGIATYPEHKIHFRNRRNNLKIPDFYSDDLAEFFGIMLGDGHVDTYQTIVSLGTKEIAYARYVSHLMEILFNIPGTIRIDDKNYSNVYIGSSALTNWLRDQGLVSNKVASQVEAPLWIFNRSSYMERFLRGFFDTDGSIYKLKFGVQISLTNYSTPLLASLQRMLIALNYRVSAISDHHLYITKTSDIRRFFKEIAPQNPKHQERFKSFFDVHKSAGSPVGCGD